MSQQEICIEIKPKKRKRCSQPDCQARARDKTDKCVTHGGGKRCSQPDCQSGAEGKTDKCKRHGGGRRCSQPDCKASAVGKTDKCITHGGVDVVMNPIVNPAPKVKPINVKDMEVGNDVLN